MLLGGCEHAEHAARHASVPIHTCPSPARAPCAVQIPPRRAKRVPQAYPHPRLTAQMARRSSVLSPSPSLPQLQARSSPSGTPPHVRCSPGVRFLGASCWTPAPSRLPSPSLVRVPLDHGELAHPCRTDTQQVLQVKVSLLCDLISTNPALPPEYGVLCTQLVAPLPTTTPDGRLD